MITRENLLDSLLAGPFGQDLRDKAQKSVDERRAALATDLAQFDAGCLKDAQAMHAEQQALDAKVAAIREQLRPLEQQAIDLAFRRSNHNTHWCEHRDSLWSQLRQMTCPKLTHFAEEMRLRMEASASLVRDWSGDGRTIGSNRDEVTAYQRALGEAKTQLDIAIRTGLAGKDADKFINTTRAAFPKVRRTPADSGVIPEL